MPVPSRTGASSTKTTSRPSSCSCSITPRARRIWTTEHDGKLYVWSGYMGTMVGRIWKRWPIQAERDGRAVLRIDGTRYERQLVRIESGEILEGITGAIRDKYPSQLTREGVEAGDSWLFEAAPR